MALSEAIDFYHSLLTDELAQDTAAQLSEQLSRKGLYFGDRPLSSVLRPRFLMPQQYRFLQERGELLLGAFRKVHAAAMQDARFREQFGLVDWEETLITTDPGYEAASPLSRLDAFFVHDRGGLRFTEYNAETPAGASYNDVLAGVFLGLPVMREFLKRYEIRQQSTRYQLLHVLMDCYRQWSRTRAAPRLAIVDWRNVPTYSEFVITADYFRRQGVDCVIVDPYEMEYKDGTLTATGIPIDLVYKRVLIHELIERCGLDCPLVRAVRDHAVCMVNPFRCKLLHKKLSLAVLSDEQNGHLFTEDERQAITAHIPWTRRVAERKTTYQGREVDLLHFAIDHRERFVLKPNDDYGGRGIVLGWEATSEQWGKALRQAMSEPYVLQERIDIPTSTYPVMVDGQVRFEPRILDTAPFAWHGRYIDGCLTRLSTESLVNVTAGGGSSVATFVVSERGGNG